MRKGSDYQQVDAAVKVAAEYTEHHHVRYQLLVYRILQQTLHDCHCAAETAVRLCCFYLYLLILLQIVLVCFDFYLLVGRLMSVYSLARCVFMNMVT